MGTVLDKNSAKVRKRIEGHTFDDEEGEEYEASKFRGFADYFRRKKIKLQNLDAELRSSSSKPQLFKGIVAHITGYTQPPLHILHRDIVQHGGGFLQYLDSKTMATHIIASTLPPKKSVDFSRYRIVKPAWIVDSIAAGKLLPWTEYRVLDEGPRQKVLKFDNTGGMTQESPRERRGYREQTENSFYVNQIKSSASPSLAISQFAEPANPSSLATIETGSKTPSKVQSKLSETATFEETVQLEDEGVLAEAPSDRTEAIEGHTGRQEPPKNATSEEHNAWLLSDPRLRKSSTANPDFLKQFYSESRLHHLSTWKAELKSQMQQMAAEKGGSVNKARRKPGTRRYVMHVDFDSFFCAISLKRNPEYVDKPAVVAHGTGSGSEIASCNYPAREFGVKNGMWMKRALDLCPDLKVLPYDFPAYEDASRLFYESILGCGGLVQSVSVDEALVDISSVVLSAASSQGTGIDEGSIWREQEQANKIASGLRDEIRSKTGCHVSIGIGGNILQAKVAMRKAKPAGQYQLLPEDVLGVIGELKVEQLPGVAYSIGGKLEDIGVKFVKDLRELSKERLVSVLGPKTGEKLRDYARGIDKIEVGEQPPRKSVSAEVNWGIRFINQPEAEEFVFNLCKELERRLLNEQVRGRQLTMKIMRRALDAPLDPAKHLGHGKCDVFNKSVTFGVPTHSYESIGKEAVSVLRSFRFSPGDLRGLGVQMTKLEPLRRNPTAPEGSQKKLTFNSFVAPSPGRKGLKTEAIDEGESPQKARSNHIGGVSGDPIAEDPLTPRKEKIHPAMVLAKAAQSDSKARTPLNVSGTQFILPSNHDSATFAELPSDIRSKLMKQPTIAGSTQPTPSKQVRPENTAVLGFSPSQIDAGVFDTLPDDMKAEVLEAYARQPGQATTHPSPEKDTSHQTNKQPTPTKRPGSKSALSKPQRQRDAQAGLFQTNFKATRSSSETPQDEPVEELDEEFLFELPEEMRKEIVAEHRRQRMAQLSGLDVPSRPQPILSRKTLPGGQRQIEFPKHPPKVEFANSGVTSVQEIKDMLDAWHSGTREEGPHRGDVQVFETYLMRVIQEERDMDKVGKLFKWLRLLVEQDESGRNSQRAWRKSVDDIRKAIQGAIKQRGLAPLDI